MHGVRHVSRRPVAVLVLRTSFQQDRCGSFPAAYPPAGSVLCRTYDIHLEQCARVLFGFKKQLDTESSPRCSRPRRCNRKTQTRHWPQGDAARCAFFLCGTKVYGTARALNSFSTAANPVSRTSVKVSFPSPLLELTTTWVFQKCLAPVCAVHRLRVPSCEHLTWVREGTGTALLIC